MIQPELRAAATEELSVSNIVDRLEEDDKETSSVTTKTKMVTI